MCFGKFLRASAVCVLGLLALFAGAKEPVQLRLSVWEGDQALTILKQVVGEFEAAHPGIRVKVEPVNYGNYQEKLLTQVAARVAPDVAMMDPGNFQRYARRNAILPLGPFIEADPSFRIEDYYSKIVDAHSLGGELFVLPRDIAPIGLIYYNKQHFRTAGLPDPPRDWTWDFQPRPELGASDFLTVIDKLTQRDAEGKTTRYGFVPGWPQAILDVFIYSQGARYVDDPEAPGELPWTDPRIERALDLMIRMQFKDRVMPSPNEMTSSLMMGSTDLFVQGKVSMMQSGIWEVPNLRKKLIPGTPGFFEWDIALAPAFRDGTRAMPTGGSGYCILSQTQHPDEAWLLTKWLAGEPAMVAMARTGLAQPAIRRLAQSDAWLPGPNTPLAERYPQSRFLTDVAVDSVVFDPTSDLWPEMKSFWSPVVDRTLSGAQTPKAALAEAKSRATERLNTLRAEEELPKFPWLPASLVALALILSLGFWVFWPERGKWKGRAERKEARIAALFLSPWLIGMLVFTLGPMAFSLLMSFSDWDIIQPAKWRGMANYQEAVAVDPRFWPSITVTTIYTVVSVPLGLAVALGMALLLNMKVRGMPVYRTLFYLPSLASGVAVALIWKAVFRAEGGLLNAILYGPNGEDPFRLAGLLNQFSPNGPINWLGDERTALASMILMSIWGAGGAMVVLLAGLQGIPEMYYEAATLDGASVWQRFKTVTIPMLGPALLFSFITGLIGSFQVFTQAFIMTSGGPGDSTRFYMLHLYQQAFVNLRMGYASALAWILFVIILVLTVLQLRLNKRIYYEGASR